MVIAVCQDSNGETGRSLETRKKEHIRNVKKCKVGSNIAKHAWDNDHAINFANCKVIDRANFRHRGTLESWHTAITINTDFCYNNYFRIFL